MEQIGLGGSCHWCTEAIFLSLKGVSAVRQGWLAAAESPDRFSEGVIVTFDPEIIARHTLIAVHLHTHSCTAEHSLRQKYISAVYSFSDIQLREAADSIIQLQDEFAAPIVTAVLPFGRFRENEEKYRNYYYSDPEKPFCQTYIRPKLQLLLERFSAATTL